MLSLPKHLARVVIKRGYYPSKMLRSALHDGLIQLKWLA